jgi:hypothetical protein
MLLFGWLQQPDSRGKIKVTIIALGKMENVPKEQQLTLRTIAIIVSAHRVTDRLVS